MANLSDALQKVKLYLIEVGVKRLGPAVAASAVSTLLALMAAHQGLLERFGITFGTWPLQWSPDSEPSGPVILIELATLTKMGLAGVLALVGTLSTLSAHHGADVLDKVLPPPKPDPSVPDKP